MKKKLEELSKFAEILESRSIPNIPDLAARGGLQPSDGSPFRLGAVGDQLTLQAYGNGTPTVRLFAAIGFESDIFAARTICIEHPEARDPEFIIETYRDSFGFMGRDWVERRIIEQRDAIDYWPTVQELDERLRSYATIGPALDPLPKTRPYERTIWRGTDRKFADYILAQYRAGQISAKSEMDALEQACRCYKRGNGTKFNPRSLRQNLRNRELEGKGPW